ncbi:Hsp70 family protein [Kitasatospora nipponensis]|uniref:Hsp70 family protein n=1 Tax=Kitasatospora nipponensis TaxID=258049 RepID=UPI0031E11113
MAIDFGTCFSTAATRVEPDGTARAVEIENSRYLPSLVCLDDAGTLLTGRAAAQLAAQRPELAEQAPKRALVRQEAVLLGGREFATADLAAAVLRRAAEAAAAEHGGRPPRGTVLTHPADWSPVELARLTHAADLAGLSVPELVPEPVAAARYHAARTAPPPHGAIAVYDLGGGTLDTAVLDWDGTRFSATAVAGDPDFGGRDLDQALLDLLRERALDLDPRPWQRLWDATTPTARHQQSALRAALTLAKEALSSTATVYLTVPGYPEPFVVQGGEYREAIAPALSSSVALLERTVARAGRTPGDLHALVLAGAASRTPQVSDLIAARLGRLPEIAADPKASVVLGALTEPPSTPRDPAQEQGPQQRPDEGPARRWAVTRYPDEVDPHLDGRLIR